MRRLTILLLSLALLLALPGCSAREQSIYEQDYDYLWYLLENEYPHYYVAERLRDRDLDEIKTGKVSAIRFSTLEAICEALDCQPGDILEYSPPRSE